MNNDVFEKFRSLIHAEAGINLTPDKKSLLMNRIGKRLRELQINNEQEYLNIIETDADGDELIKLIDAVSTNVTYFYREESHFVKLAEIFDEYKKQGKKDLKLWCAASSSGEEPYTLGMVAEESFNSREGVCKILATDISTRVLNHAVKACYMEKQLEKLPKVYKNKYFNFSKSDSDYPWEVKENIRSNVIFKKLNLAKFPYPLKGGLDIIFCRNVMIYFDLALRRKIIAECSRLLNKDGYLFLSHSENLLGIDHNFKSCGVSVFKKI